MRYKKRQVVAGVKIISTEKHQQNRTRKNASGRTVVWKETKLRYKTENKSCRCVKRYNHNYLRSLDVAGKKVKCMTCDRKKKVNISSSDHNSREFSPLTDVYAVDSIVKPETQDSGWVWGMQGLDNLRSYRLAAKS